MYLAFGCRSGKGTPKFPYTLHHGIQVLQYSYYVLLGSLCIDAVMLSFQSCTKFRYKVPQIIFRAPAEPSATRWRSGTIKNPGEWIQDEGVFLIGIHPFSRYCYIISLLFYVSPRIWWRLLPSDSWWSIIYDVRH